MEVEGVFGVANDARVQTLATLIASDAHGPGMINRHQLGSGQPELADDSAGQVDQQVRGHEGVDQAFGLRRDRR